MGNPRLVGRRTDEVSLQFPTELSMRALRYVVASIACMAVWILVSPTLRNKTIRNTYACR